MRMVPRAIVNDLFRDCNEPVDDHPSSNVRASVLIFDLITIENHSSSSDPVSIFSRFATSSAQHQLSLHWGCCDFGSCDVSRRDLVWNRFLLTDSSWISHYRALPTYQSTDACVIWDWWRNDDCSGNTTEECKTFGRIFEVIYGPVSGCGTYCGCQDGWVGATRVSEICRVFSK
jgi:hypothetical protein